MDIIYIKKDKPHPTPEQRSTAMEKKTTQKGSNTDSIKLLATLDEKYLPPLQVLLTSLYINNPGEKMELYILHSGIPTRALEAVEKQCIGFGYKMISIQIGSSYFTDAPITKQYPREMYYRLLAPHLLPSDLSRILYLDPDTLVINPVRPLWETKLDGRLFAAAAHMGKTDFINSINQVRLGTESNYFNSGVLLMDLEAGRREIIPQEIYQYAEEHSKELLLPDQDILNAMYGSRILEVEDIIWNYDARNYNTYLLRSGGVSDMDWVLGNTVILHFCGKSKPWKQGYFHRFGILYKHYMQLTRRTGYYLSDK